MNFNHIQVFWKMLLLIPDMYDFIFYRGHFINCVKKTFTMKALQDAGHNYEVSAFTLETLNKK